MDGVVFETLASKVAFGRGALARLPELAEALGARRVLVVATKSQAATARRALELLGPRGVAVFDRAAMHTPVEVTAEAMTLVDAEGIDGVTAVGGGSAIGLAKAIALRTDAPQIAVPTTYAGSEMTPILGETQAGRKATQRSPKVLPEAVIYDVELSLSLPAQISVVSGFNAIAHGVEALYSRVANPMLSAVAEECVRLIEHALPRIMVDPSNEAARSDALKGAWLGGWSLAHGGTALHHRLCHILGGAFDLPHAEMHTVLLPHVVAYNAEAAPEAMERLGRALGAEHPAAALFDVSRSLGAPAALKDIGMPEAGIAAALDALLADPPWNPRPLERAPLERMLEDAFLGGRPGSRMPRLRRSRRPSA